MALPNGPGYSLQVRHIAKHVAFTGLSAAIPNASNDHKPIIS